MNSTAIEGIWEKVNEIGKLKFQFGSLWGMSPRSTTRWYKPGESVGIYPTGMNPDGTKSQYSKNIESNDITILGITKQVGKNFKLHGWDMFTENVFNTAMIQTDFSIPLKNESSLFVAAQVIKQDAINNGGNTDQSKTYFLKGSGSLSFGEELAGKIQNGKLLSVITELQRPEDICFSVGSRTIFYISFP